VVQFVSSVECLVLYFCFRFYLSNLFCCFSGTNSKVIYEEDLFPGDIFGEAVLSGMHTRLLTALSMTSVDLAVIDDQDFMTAQDRDSVQMGTEEKSKFLSSVPMFRHWDSYKLLRLAHCLVQDEFDKSSIVTRHNSISKEIYFVVNGRVDVIDSLSRRNTITSLLRYDYFGESGFLNKYMHKIPSSSSTQSSVHNKLSHPHHNSSNHGQQNHPHHHRSPSPSSASKNSNPSATANAISRQKVHEEFYAIATTKLEVLILNEANFHLFDMSSIEPFRDAFLAKIQWRRDRVQKMKFERSAVRKKYASMSSEADLLPEWLSPEYLELTSSTSTKGIPFGRPRSPFPGLDDEPHDRSVSPSQPRPQSARRNDDDGVKEDKPHLALADQAYKASLVHPLDDRLTNQLVWFGHGPTVNETLPQTVVPEDEEEEELEDEKQEKKRKPRPMSKRALASILDNQSTLNSAFSVITPQEKQQKDVHESLKSAQYVHMNREKQFLINNLSDIPIILAKDYDLLMVSSSCDDRFFSKATDFLLQGKRPLSGKTVPYRAVSPSKQSSHENKINEEVGKSTSVSAPNTPKNNNGAESRNAFSATFRGVSSISTENNNDRIKPAITVNTGIAFYENKGMLFSGDDNEDDGVEIIPIQTVTFDDTIPLGMDLPTKVSPSNRKKSSPFIKPTFSLPNDHQSRRSSLISPLSRDLSQRNEYQFKFMDENETGGLFSPSPVDNGDRKILQRPFSSPAIGGRQSVEHSRPATAGSNNRQELFPVHVPTATVPSDSNLMVVKGLNNKAPERQQHSFSASNPHKSTKASICRNVNTLSRPHTAMSQAISKPVTTRRNSVIAIEIDLDGNEVAMDFQTVNRPASAHPRIGHNPIPSSKLPFLNSVTGGNAVKPLFFQPSSALSSASNGVAVRGHFLLINPSDKKLESNGGVVSNSIQTLEKKNTSNFLVSDDRRSNQPLRLLAPGSSKLVTQRRKKT
jgi:CRP-like cAMP-binding protein